MFQWKTGKLVKYLDTFKADGIDYSPEKILKDEKEIILNT